jgi:hypothetical protein
LFRKKPTKKSPEKQTRPSGTVPLAGRTTRTYLQLRTPFISVSSQTFSITIETVKLIYTPSADLTSHQVFHCMLYNYVLFGQNPWKCFHCLCLQYVKYRKIAALLNPGESEVILSARHKHRLFITGQSNKKSGTKRFFFIVVP